jgi:deoxyguanosine kinase
LKTENPFALIGHHDRLIMVITIFLSCYRPAQRAERWRVYTSRSFWQSPPFPQPRTMERHQERPRYIAVEGPIGVGKTTLAQFLADRMGGRLVLEPIEENPFLPGFYEDSRKNAFQTQLFFLLSRFQQQRQLFQQDLFTQSTVADYLFAKDRIFAALTLDQNELALYDRLYEVLGPRVVKPDLVIYLQARTEVLLKRISRRGRDYEREIAPAYVEALASAYNDFFFHYDDSPLLVVNTSDIDIVRSEADMEALAGVIKRHRKGTQHYLPMATGR